MTSFDDDNAFQGRLLLSKIGDGVENAKRALEEDGKKDPWIVKHIPLVVRGTLKKIALKIIDTEKNSTENYWYRKK